MPRKRFILWLNVVNFLLISFFHQPIVVSFINFCVGGSLSVRLPVRNICLHPCETSLPPSVLLPRILDVSASSTLDDVACVYFLSVINHSTSYIHVFSLNRLSAFPSHPQNVGYGSFRRPSSDFPFFHFFFGNLTLRTGALQKYHYIPVTAMSTSDLKKQIYFS